MALGVLNNLSAIYAENNLNNTSSSLQTVLQQLSSGSRINSGADDAAGLSLVNGLEANAAALTQSGTNSTEGVGLLQVADGALSQVTNLLNRAITLATEASNGTLNKTQEAAANQEYQSILSEINNIGTTTTYNQEQVFSGSTVAIYTGDSSTAGSSIDDLNIRALSEGSVGDTAGTMSYSDGQDNVFINLSTSTTNAEQTDTLNASGATTIDVEYLVKGAVGASSTATTQISVGTGTSYSNTVGGLISAINNAGLGLTASFADQTTAGITGGGTQTGIQIAGGLVSAGVDPSGVSTSGTFNASGIPANQLLTLGQSVTIEQGGLAVGMPISINSSLNTLTELAGYINNVSNGYSTSVTASVITNGDGTQSLSLTNAGSSEGALNIITTPGTGATTPVFGVPVAAGNAPLLDTTTGTTGVAQVVAVNGSYTFGAGGTGNRGTDALSAGGSITINNTYSSGTVSMTFVVGAGTDNGTTMYTANHGDGTNSLSNLATTIQADAALGVTASVGAAGITVTSTTAATNDNITITGQNTISNANNTIGLYNPTDGGAAVTAVNGVVALDTIGQLGTATIDDTFTNGQSITLHNSANGNNYTFTAGVGQNSYADLMTGINASNLGVTASWNATDHALLLTTTGAPNTVSVTSNTLVDTTHAGAVQLDPTNYKVTGVVGSAGSYSTAVLQLNSGDSMTSINDVADKITGQIVLQNGAGASQTFIMGSGTDGANVFYTANHLVGGDTANSVAGLVDTINADAAFGASAMAPGGGTGGIYIQSNTVGVSPIAIVGTPTLADAITMSATTPAASGRTAVTGVDSTELVALATGTVNTTDTLATGGQITITNNLPSAPGIPITHHFIVGSGADTATTFYTDNTAPSGVDYGNTLAGLAALISSDAGLGLSAQASTAGLALTSVAGEGTAITVNSSTITDTTLGSPSTVTLGTFANESDTIAGTLNFSVGGVAKSVIINANSTVQDLVGQINGDSSLAVQASWVATSNGFGNLVLTSNAQGTAGQLSGLSAAVIDTTPTASLSYVAAGPYNTGLTSDSTNVVYDTTSGQGTGAALQPAAATFIANSKLGSGAATISYSDSAGESLSGTTLLSATSAESALTSLNVAISDIAAMDGYIGAQINTLNSLSQVMTTQQENVVSAQNAIQATDYAAATSNMSKYEILSQTGIAALAQANSVQQEVTKLLQ